METTLFGYEDIYLNLQAALEVYQGDRDKVATLKTLLWELAHELHDYRDGYEQWIDAREGEWQKMLKDLVIWGLRKTHRLWTQYVREQKREARERMDQRAVYFKGWLAVLEGRSNHFLNQSASDEKVEEPEELEAKENPSEEGAISPEIQETETHSERGTPLTKSEPTFRENFAEKMRSPSLSPNQVDFWVRMAIQEHTLVEEEISCQAEEKWDCQVAGGCLRHAMSPGNFEILRIVMVELIEEEISRLDQGGSEESRPTGESRHLEQCDRQGRPSTRKDPEQRPGMDWA